MYQETAYKLKALTRQLIETHYEHLLDANVQACEKYLTSKQFLKEVRTISIGTGRQTGKTTLISEMVDDKDLIITINSNFVKNIKKLCELNGKNPDIVASKRNLIELLTLDKERKFNRIFVDDADYLHDGMLVSRDFLIFIYENVAGRCNQLILIRG